MCGVFRITKDVIALHGVADVSQHVLSPNPHSHLLRRSSCYSRFAHWKWKLGRGSVICPRSHSKWPPIHSCLTQLPIAWPSWLLPLFLLIPLIRWNFDCLQKSLESSFSHQERGRKTKRAVDHFKRTCCSQNVTEGETFITNWLITLHGDYIKSCLTRAVFRKS